MVLLESLREDDRASLSKLDAFPDALLGAFTITKVLIEVVAP